MQELTFTLQTISAFQSGIILETLSHTLSRPRSRSHTLSRALSFFRSHSLSLSLFFVFPATCHFFFISLEHAFAVDNGHICVVAN